MAPRARRAAQRVDRVRRRACSYLLTKRCPAPSAPAPESSAFDPPLGLNSLLKRMLDRQHFGYEVRELDQLRRRAAAREHKMQSRRLRTDNLKQLVERDEVRLYGAKDLIQDDHVVRIF